MKVIDTLKQSLLPIGIYDLSLESNNHKELSAYAKGLELLSEELSEMVEECFISTACSYGLVEYERLWGGVRDDLPLSKRREMLLARSALNLGDFTPKGAEKIFTLLGIEGTLSEYPSQQRISLNLVGDSFSKGQKNFILSQTKALFPAHLDVDVVFSGLSWKSIEEKGKTFAQMEALTYTWQEIDAM